MARSSAPSTCLPERASSGARPGSAISRTSRPVPSASSDSSCSGANFDRRRCLMQKLRAMA